MTASKLHDRVSDVSGALDVLRRLDIQGLDYAARKNDAIREWAIAQACDFVVGDKVVIGRCPIDESSGWWSYREALAPGQTAVAREIDFNLHYGYWYADVLLDREWAISSGTFQGIEGTRWWHGPASETPEGYEPPSSYDQDHHPEGRRHTFALPVEWLRKA